MKFLAQNKFNNRACLVQVAMMMWFTLPVLVDIQDIIVVGLNYIVAILAAVYSLYLELWLETGTR